MATKWYTTLEVAWNRYPILCQGHPSNFKVTRAENSTILTLIEHFRTLTPVSIHKWLRNYVKNLKRHKRGAPFFSGHLSHFKVTMAEKSMVWLPFEHFRMTTPIWIHRWLWINTYILRAWKRFPIFFEVICQISRSHGLKNLFESDMCNITRPITAIKSLKFVLLIFRHSSV